MSDEDRPDTASDAPSPGPEARSPKEGEDGISAPKLEADLSDSVTIRSAAFAGDGAVEVRVADDWMSAFATFHPPQDNGRPVSPDFVTDMLARVGVTECILREEIAEAVLACNLERHFIRDRVVAEGITPQEEVPEHAAIDSRFAERSSYASADALRVDWRSLASQPVVKKDEVLAHIVKKSEGRLGKNLRGEEIPVPRRAVKNWNPGKNVVRTEDSLRASVDGLLIMAGDTLSVEEVFVVKGGVDFHTGHIVFPGDVVIEGKVSDGFKVWSGASIYCKTTLDAFDVNARKDLVCLQGIIGRRNGHVRVGGKLTAKFIENCRIASRGDISVSSAIMGSRVYSLGLLDLGDKGVLMGGETWAVHGVKAARLGNQAKQRTVVHVGIDFTVQQRLDQANERLRVIALRAQQIDVLAANRPGLDPTRLHREAEKALDETRLLILKLLSELDSDESAVVEVKGEVFPGTIIDVCRVEITIDEVMRGCRFRLDKAAGRVMIEHLGAKADAPAKKTGPAPTQAKPSAAPPKKPS